MTRWVSGVKNIIKYDQDTEPVSPVDGDVWFDSSSYNLKVYSNSEWKNIYVNNSPFGYSLGGGISPEISEIERILFPFDSGVGAFVGNLSEGKRALASCNSSNYGFIMGGWGATYIKKVDRITFPFDSGTADDIGDLSKKMGFAAGCNSSTHGFTMGGAVEGGDSSEIERIVFPFDSGTAVAIGNLHFTTHLAAGCNSSTHGYNIGGYDLIELSTLSTDRILFPFNSGTSDIVGNLTYSRCYGGGCNSSNYGFIMGGWGKGGSDNLSSIERLLFPFDFGSVGQNTKSSNSTIIAMGVCNSSTHGYIMGGSRSSQTSIVERFCFPFDVGGSICCVGSLSKAVYFNVGMDSTDFVNLFV